MTINIGLCADDLSKWGTIVSFLYQLNRIILYHHCFMEAKCQLNRIILYPHFFMEAKYQLNRIILYDK